MLMVRHQDTYLNFKLEDDLMNEVIEKGIWTKDKYISLNYIILIKGVKVAKWRYK